MAPKQEAAGSEAEMPAATRNGGEGPGEHRGEGNLGAAASSMPVADPATHNDTVGPDATFDTQPAAMGDDVPANTCSGIYARDIKSRLERIKQMRMNKKLERGAVQLHGEHMHSHGQQLYALGNPVSVHNRICCRASV